MGEHQSVRSHDFKCPLLAGGVETCYHLTPFVEDDFAPTELRYFQTVRMLIVGAGFTGRVVARELAEAGLRSLVIDERSRWPAGIATRRGTGGGCWSIDIGPLSFIPMSDRAWAYVAPPRIKPRRRA